MPPMRQATPQQQCHAPGMRSLIAALAAAFAIALVVVAPASANSHLVDHRHCDAVLHTMNGTLISPDRAGVAIPSSHMPSARWTRHRGPSSGQLKIICESLPCPCAGAGAAPTTPAPAPPPAPATATSASPAARTGKVLEASARVTSVIDGDTLKIRLANGAAATVRLIGIDTPETRKPGTPVQCGGRAATARMKQLALRRGKGRSVSITTDPTQDLTDRYGRLLAYVGAAGTDFGRTMVASGWAKTYVYRVDFQRVNTYRSAQRSAKSAGRGVFGRCAGDVHRSATSNR